MELPDKLAVKFFSPAVEENELLVRELEGVEELSRLFRFDIELYSENPNIDLAAILKDSVWLGFRHGVALSGDSRGTVMRKIHGVLASFEQLDPIKSWHRYRAVLVPRLWKSTLTSNSRIFMKKPIPKFTEDVLKESGLSGDDYSFKSVLDADAEMEYVMQYQETDFNFVSRWWEDEGIAYRFDHSDERATLALFNSDSAYVPVEGDTTATYNPTALPDQELGDEEWLRPPVVGTFLCRQKTIPRKLVLSDYNYRTPSTDLKVEHDVDSEDGAGTVYEYSSHYKDAEEGKAVAQVRAERYLCTKKVFSGASDAKGFRPGATFSLEKHPRENFNQEYLLVKVRHQARQSLGSGTGSAAGASYRNEFECIESVLVFRPERASTWPLIPGLINAKVDDASDGKYAEIDELGRYNVKLPLDLSDAKDGQASRRIRMAQPYAGPNGTNPYGMHFPLHKKTEVLLGCIDGDPDRPIIVNAVPNPESSSPVYNEHHTQCVIRTGSGNEISLEDEEDQEGILTYTPKHKSFTQLGAHINDENEGVSSKTEGSFMAASKDDWNAATEANLEAQAKGHIDIHSQQSTCIYAVKPPADPLWKKILKLIFRNEDEGEFIESRTRPAMKARRKPPTTTQDLSGSLTQRATECASMRRTLWKNAAAVPSIN